MAIRVLDTTDGKYIGAVLAVSSADAPTTLTMPDGAVLESLEWHTHGEGQWTVCDANYILIVQDC